MPVLLVAPELLEPLVLALVLVGQTARVGAVGPASLAVPSLERAWALELQELVRL